MKRQTENKQAQRLAIFSNDEMDQLHKSFNLTLYDLNSIVSCCCFVLEQVCSFT